MPGLKKINWIWHYVRIQITSKIPGHHLKQEIELETNHRGKKENRINGVVHTNSSSRGYLRYVPIDLNHKELAKQNVLRQTCLKHFRSGTRKGNR